MTKILTILGLLVASTVGATPLRLDYSVENAGGGQYQYEFRLVLDNNDNSWVPGQGWGWLIFGDAQEAPSPLLNFVGDASDLPVGPWTAFSYSGGYHNGPTFAYVLDYWIPLSVGETLSWSGTSTADLAQGQLLFSSLVITGGAQLTEFAVAQRVAVPEPSTIAFMGTGLLAIGLLGRRRRS